MPWASDPSLKATEDFISRGIQYWCESQPKELPMIIELKTTGEIISASGFNEKSDFSVPIAHSTLIATKTIKNMLIKKLV